MCVQELFSLDRTVCVHILFFFIFFSFLFVSCIKILHASCIVHGTAQYNIKSGVIMGITKFFIHNQNKESTTKHSKCNEYSFQKQNAIRAIPFHTCIVYDIYKSDFASVWVCVFVCIQFDEIRIDFCFVVEWRIFVTIVIHNNNFIISQRLFGNILFWFSTFNENWTALVWILTQKKKLYGWLHFKNCFTFVDMNGFICIEPRICIYTFAFSSSAVSIIPAQR